MMSQLLPAIAWTLIHFCWQAAAIAAIYGALSMALARRSSRTRYLLALAALLAMLAAAGITFGLQLRANAPAPVPAGFNQVTLAAALPSTVQQAILSDGSANLRAAANLSLRTLLPWIDGLWLLGVLILSLRSLGGWWLIRRLRLAADFNIPAAVQVSFARIASALGVRRPVELRLSGSVAGPVTIGVLRAAVLLPLSALTALGPDELDVVLAHELAHVRRADFLWNLVQTFAETLFFFHPAVWWIGSALRQERELCCDDMALKVCPNPVVYASALFHLEEQRARQPHLAMALDGNRPASALRMRILRILGEPVSHMKCGPSRAFSLSVACAGLMILVFPTSQVMASLRAPQLNASSEAAGHALAGVVPAHSAVANAKPSPSMHLSTPEAVRETAPSPEPVWMAQNEPAPSQASSGPKSTYIDRMKAAGYDVDLDKLIAMKIQGITPEYARTMAEAGFGKLNADQLVAAKIQGLAPETLKQLKQQVPDLDSIDDAIAYRIFQVTPEFIAGLKAAGYKDLTSKQLIAMRVQGVTPEYARSVAQQFPGATTEDLIRMRIFRIDAAFLELAKKHGFTDLNIDKLVKLRISGVLDEEK